MDFLQRISWLRTSLPLFSRILHIEKVVINHQSFLNTVCLAALYSPAKNLTIWQHSCGRNCWCWDVVFELTSRVIQIISGTVERWIADCLAFAVETYLKNSDLVIFTQRIFHWHFSIHRKDSVASHNTLLLWMRNIRETASAAKTKPTEKQPVLRTPENVKRLLQTFVGSLRR
jgi:ribosomal protein S15P/S13E